jgi:hypothetical protein
MEFLLSYIRNLELSGVDGLWDDDLWAILQHSEVIDWAALEKSDSPHDETAHKLS